MFIGRMLVGRKLGLTLAFAVLVALAFSVSCTGFFPKNSLTAITIQPPTPQIEVGTAQNLQAWGTYANNTGTSQITSGVVWTSSDNTVLTINATTGVATGVGTGGSATITASAQGLSGTASANVYLGSITSFTLCTPTFGVQPLPWQPAGLECKRRRYCDPNLHRAGYLRRHNYDFTTASTWTVVSQPTNGITITCSNSGVSPETCQVNQGDIGGNLSCYRDLRHNELGDDNIVVTN